MIEAAEQEYSTLVHTPSPSTNDVSASFPSLPSIAIESTVAEEEEPRTAQLENVVSISSTPFELNHEGREPKMPRTVSTTNFLNHFQLTQSKYKRSVYNFRSNIQF